MTPARNVLASESEQGNTAQNGAAQSEAAQSEAARQLAVLNTIAEESADCVKVLDLEARLLSMNAGGMLSMEIDDFTVCRSLLWPDFWHGEDRLQVEAALDRARAGQRSLFEGQSATFKGTPRWWEVRVAPILGSGGAVEQLLAVSRDITERKRAEQALAELNVSLEAQVAARTLQIESQARAQDAFVAFTEAVGGETDDLALALQAIEVLLLHFPADSAGFYFRRGSEVRGPDSARSGDRGGETGGDVWQVQASSGTFPGGFRPPETLAADHPLIAPVLQTGQPVFIGDWSATPGRLNTAQTFGAAASVPLVIAGGVRGMFMVGLRHTQTWSERDQALLRAVGRGLTLALERSERVQQAEETARAQDAFVALTEAVGTQTGVLALAQQAIEVLQAHLPGATASFQVPEGNLWKASAWSQNLSEVVVTLITAGVPGTHPIIAQMVREQRPIFVDQWEHAPEHQVAASELSRTVAAYPLMVGGEVLGMLSVCLPQARAWQKRDQALVWAVGRALNLALERADSLGQLGERSRELERLNSELGRERSFLSTVLENLSEGVVACDELGRLTLFNNATRTFHGLDASPLPPEEWAEHYDLYEADGVTPLVTERVPLYRAWRGERLRDVEIVIRPKGDQSGEGQTGDAQAGEKQVRQLLASGQPMFTPGGQPLGAVVTMRDVTARRAAEQRLQVTVEQLQRSNAELSVANEELEAFAYSASHDLRTPVRHVQSFSELARKAMSSAPNEGAERYLGHVEQAAQRMSSLIDSLLSLSRTSRQDLTPAPVDLELLLRRARKDMQGELAGRDVQWRTSALPVVVGDQALLQQVMNNLLANAVKFSRNSEQALIEVWSEEDSAAWTVYVRDNGAGFDPRYRGRLFGVFQRLHSEREFEGTGVGLATVRRIVLRHGGNVSASSVPGEGATFGFTLPKQR